MGSRLITLAFLSALALNCSGDEAAECPPAGTCEEGRHPADSNGDGCYDSCRDDSVDAYTPRNDVGGRDTTVADTGNYDLGHRDTRTEDIGIDPPMEDIVEQSFCDQQSSPLLCDDFESDSSGNWLVGPIEGEGVNPAYGIENGALRFHNYVLLTQNSYDSVGEINFELKWRVSDRRMLFGIDIIDQDEAVVFGMVVDHGNIGYLTHDPPVLETIQEADTAWHTSRINFDPSRGEITYQLDDQAPVTISNTNPNTELRLYLVSASNPGDSYFAEVDDILIERD